MKKLINIYIAVLVCAFGAYSCTDFLDTPVLGLNADTPVYYDSPDNARMALVGCYNGLVKTHKDGGYKWVFGDVRSDDAWKGGDHAGGYITAQYIAEWTIGANEGHQRALWSAAYTAIFYCNTAIAAFENITFDDDIKVQYIAEAKFIRAYNYFLLASHFGDVPLFTKTVEADKIKDVTRTPYADVLAQVEKDLKEAAAVLPLTYPDEDTGRITVGAAKALHARVTMYAIGIFKTKSASDWQQVYDLTSDIINSGVYGLHRNYPEIFEAEGENCEESVFELQFKTTKTGWGPNNQGNPCCIMVASCGIDGNKGWGWNYNTPTYSLVNEFEENDPRLYATVHGRDTVRQIDITPYVYGKREYVDYSQTYITGFNARKLTIEVKPDEHSDGPYNERIIRYSDVLLMKAEAAFHLNKESETRQLINQVRERARKSTYPKGYVSAKNTYEPTYFSNNLPDIASSVGGAQLLAALKHERRVEFGMESLRYWDLVRWGDYESILTAEVKANFQRRQLRGLPVLPIPAEEVSSWGLEQNPM